MQRTARNNSLVGQLFALDFDQTLTINHTFVKTAFNDAHGLCRLPFVSVKKRGFLFGCIPQRVESNRQETPDFSYTISDQEVKSNLRNPDQIRKIINHIFANGGKVCILTKHDNSAWVKRNVRLLLNDMNLVNQINVYALQASEFDCYFGNKLTALRSINDNNPDIKKITLIDSDINEINQVSKFMTDERTRPLHHYSFSVIHAEVGSSYYLTMLAKRVNCELPVPLQHERSPLISHR